MSKSGSSLAGITLAVIIAAAIVSIGYFQVDVAPVIFTTTTTTTTTAVACTPSNCVNVTIPAGAGTPAGAPGYAPDTIVVVIGVNNTVNWVNADSSIHTVTANDNSFNSGNMNQGDSFVYTFTTPGTYKYHCIYHSWMQGTVIVKNK